MTFKGLATDLDGTLIPLEGRAQNQRDLATLSELVASEALQLVFVTGRHFASVLAALDEFSLPQPDWILCDVGTSVYQRGLDGTFCFSEAYAARLAELTGECTTEHLSELVDSFFLGRDDIRRQESEKQSRYKLSYYARAEWLENSVTELRAVVEGAAVPYSVVASIDPFTGDGLVDFLPQGVSKAFALNWWCQEQRLEPSEVMFAGDSGNDLAVFVDRFPVVLVGNTHAEVVAQVHQARSPDDPHLFLASQPATSGVLQGLQHFLTSRQQPL